MPRTSTCRRCTRKSKPLTKFVPEQFNACNRLLLGALLYTPLDRLFQTLFFGCYRVVSVQESVEISTALPMEVISLQRDGWKAQSISAGGVHSAAILTLQPE